MQQAEDFRDECDAIKALLEPLSDADYEQSSGFKGWTFNQILRHLHVWNYAADLALQDADSFRQWLKDASNSVGSGRFTDFEASFLDGLAGQPLLERWAAFYPEMAERFAACDPAARLPWAGPSMSARSSITARLMESWAHAQAIYDALGVERQNGDRIRNIVVLGLNTYGWTFKNRGLEPPEPRPQLRLRAPSGELWEFGDPTEGERIEGPAEAFCQVVTQTRNIADTKLEVSGANATRWMSIAQCFAGPPNDPPAPGERGLRR